MTLMTHLYYGDPNEEFSLKLAKTLLDSGADILEIGIPYTDPVCDGEVFQRSCQRAFLNGITPFMVLQGISKIRKNYKQPIYLTSYYGPIFKIGIKNFVGKAKEAGVNGLIIPDLLLEEQNDLRRSCKIFELPIIQFATVYSSDDRLKKIIGFSTDFIYCVALPGLTGEKVREGSGLSKSIKSLRGMTKKKIFVGFGISSHQDATKIIGVGADGVIVGSAIARIYEKNISQPNKSLDEISSFIKSIKKVQ